MTGHRKGKGKKSNVKKKEGGEGTGGQEKRERMGVMVNDAWGSTHPRTKGGLRGRKEG